MAHHRAPMLGGLAAALAVAVFGLSACATGPRMPDPPAYAAWSRGHKVKGVEARRVLIPKASSDEYKRSWGVRLVNPDPAFRAGVTGRGVTVAVIDTGLAWAQPEVVNGASKSSTDLIETRKIDGRFADHGGGVAGAVSAALDGGGLVGVAYGATLLSIRADLDGSCQTDCTFRTRDLARGMDYALANGARIIVLAVEGHHRLSPIFEGAMERATAAGAVIVAAAGNEMDVDPAWPARYAADPRFARSVVAVGAARPDGRLAAWSNRAGSTRARYLTAPGDRLFVNCDEKYCRQVSGTSYATAYVAGAIALVMEARPDLSAQDAADLVLQAGRATGDGASSGRGLLDVGRSVDAARRRLAQAQ